MDLKPAGDFEQHLETQPHSADSLMYARPSAIFLCYLLQLRCRTTLTAAAQHILSSKKQANLMHAGHSEPVSTFVETH